MPVVVFDLESDSGDMSDDFRWMQITVGCCIVVDTALCLEVGPEAGKRALAAGTQYTFWRDVAPARNIDPFAKMLELFDDADAIVAYNGLYFDMSLLRRHYGRNEERYMRHRLKVLDTFDRIKGATNRWPKLDVLLSANGLPSKSGDGKKAIRLWEAQKRDELEAYCMDDVKLLLQLVILDDIHYPGVGVMPNSLGGLKSFLISRAITA